ncbi:eukaryotic translation initiation factor 2B delta subunit [Neolentinus lepideus HHB14362 ss-1]|uniref:Translation initiation factor eIF2B subunit delta n=1 Tax=Neolentinus lepideus HHB14362 ss-1 TaxID=1314782 RepID=A0A165TQ85_9AGAM|nr:eukaryotic translation initiation factor 2B delta subunit [Neolentinus lepideus HHB14362 ss-1]
MPSAVVPLPEAAGQSSAPPGTLPAKSQKQMTKAERREMQERQRAAKAEKATQNQSKNSPKSSNKPAQTSKEGALAPRRASKAADLAPKGFQGAGGQSKDVKASGEDKSAHTRGLRIFSHFGLPKPTAHKGEVHPTIVRLGLQFSEFKITGANARCIATLTAFKTVIQDYVTPPNNTLSRHLMTYLSPQISYLVSARPMSVTMGNAIRQLKLDISGTDIDLPEQDAKDALCDKIDTYIRDRIIAADQVIEETAGNKIKDGDAILTYARSSVVEKVLLAAYADGKQFTVTVVDSRPMLEGKKLLEVLSFAGIQCTYLLLPAVGSVITEISMVLVGAHSLHSNGAVFSRAGTALVAMMAKQHLVPVVVCCETYKFSETVQLDSFTRNELAPVELFNSFPQNKQQDLSSLSDQPNLQILNPLYDLTPPSSITAVVTEVGVIPPSSISSIPLALGRTML